MAPMKKTTRRRVSPFAETLSLDQAAQKLGVTRLELRRMLGRGEMPFEQVRGRIRVPRKAVVRVTEARVTKT